MRFKAPLLFPEAPPYVMYCFQASRACKRPPAFPDGDGQVEASGLYVK